MYSTKQPSYKEQIRLVLSCSLFPSLIVQIYYYVSEKKYKSIILLKKTVFNANKKWIYQFNHFWNVAGEKKIESQFLFLLFSYFSIIDNLRNKTFKSLSNRAETKFLFYVNGSVILSFNKHKTGANAMAENVS